MKEAIYIRNLGPIVEVEFDDIKPLTVLIGESGSGKSTILKTLAMFQWVFKMMNIRSYFALAGVKSPFRFSWDTLVRNAGFEGYLKENTEIVYKNGNCEISYRDGKLNTGYKFEEEELSLEKIAFVSDKRNLISDIMAARIPKKVDSFYLNETLEDFKKATRIIRQHDMPYLKVSLSLEKTANGERYFIKCTEDDGLKVNFEDASSGMQNVSPLSVIVEYFSKSFDVVTATNQMVLRYLTESDGLKNFSATRNIGEIKQRNIHIHIEEPELSLFPESQKALVDTLIDRCFSGNERNISLMMATHSPYIVNYLNLLIARAEHGIEHSSRIDFDKVDIYEIADGYAVSLKIKGQDNVFDTRVMSDPISSTYNEYNRIKNR